MVKKSFKNNISNPALQFIDQEEPNTEPEKKQKDTKGYEIKYENITPAGYKKDPSYIETKSKRVQLLLQPSVVNEAKSKAEANNISMNELFNIAIKEYLERH